MADDAIKEMIAAFALGCMDKKNFKQFREYLENNGELAKGELGDLQNIVSLIPTILDIEAPREELKNELGKRLIQIQKDINNKILEDRRQTRINITQDFIQRDSSTKIFNVSDKHTPLATGPIPSKKQKTKPEEIKNSTRLNTISEPEKPKRNLNIILLWLFTILLIVALAFISLSLSSKITLLLDKNSELEDKIIKLRTDLSRTDDYVHQNMEFVEFFNNPYIDFIPLKGINKNSKESGRLFISFATGEGLLQLRNMPHLEPDKTFQLWLVTKSGTFSLGTFEVRPDRRYMLISEIPFVMKEDIEMFRVTKEKKDGVITPTGDTILFGTFTKEHSTKKRRRR